MPLVTLSKPRPALPCSRLQQQEASLEAEAQRLLGELRLEVAGYGGYSAAEVEELLVESCLPGMRHRAAEAAALLERVSETGQGEDLQWHSMHGWTACICLDSMHGCQRL